MKISLTILCVVTLVLLLSCFTVETLAKKCKPTEVLKNKKCVPKKGKKPAGGATTAAGGETTAAGGETTKAP